MSAHWWLSLWAQVYPNLVASALTSVIVYIKLKAKFLTQQDASEKAAEQRHAQLMSQHEVLQHRVSLIERNTE